VMKYEFVEAYRSDFAVIRMCRALKINGSGYFRWRRKEKTEHTLEDERLVIAIRKIHEESKLTYGANRIKAKLEKLEIHCSIGRIRRLMRENGIYSVTRYKHKPYPKYNVETRFNENIIDREFRVFAPNKVWCGDITYVKTTAGWVYLAAVIDLFNREVVGYSLSRKPNTELATRAMANALMNRKPVERLVFHSDRGCQYSSKTYLNYLEDHDIEGSMSRKGNPYDNACTESFFATLKKEWIHLRKYRDLEHLDDSLFEYIELFYNRKRLHSSLENLTPREYYRKYTAEKTA
jgi:transposase InsO family protein